MKAIVCTKYGPPQVLKLQEVNQPVPGAGEALIKIHDASLNAADLENMRGEFVVPVQWGVLSPRTSNPNPQGHCA